VATIYTNYQLSIINYQLSIPRAPRGFISAMKRHRLIIRALFLCSLVLLSLSLAVAQIASVISIKWTPDPKDTNRAIVEVTGLSAASLRRLQRANWKLPQWQGLLSVYSEPQKEQSPHKLPPMLGVYRIESGVLRFEPQFPLEPGIIYRAIFRPARLPGAGNPADGEVTSLFQLPANKPNLSTTVEMIYPSAGVLPENLLKFYIHFSAAMSRGRIYEHIQLRGEAGKQIELPFLEIDEELWDPTMTRLTLFLDPGRIKRGVRPLEEVGPALEAGKSYILVIGSELKDGSGSPLKETFRKEFKVGPPDRDPPDPATWKIQSPQAGTRDPLAVTFTDPVDHALALRLISVAGESGESLDGKAALEDQERRWIFTPGSLWRRGTYRLVIQTTLEDLAGNNIGKPFDVDLFEGVQRRLTTSNLKIPFEVR
jgi:hypothetical protein